MNNKFMVAPMMNYTDRHNRYLLRLISKHALLYTEMVTTGALLHADPQRFLRFDMAEQPLVLQLGGNEPQALAQCAKMAEDWGYNEVNLNVGCPSDRVQNGAFGACLMLTPERVADCIAAMVSTVHIPVSVKARIGVDQVDSYEALAHFIDIVANAGCQTFIIHARKAWLQGLSPKQNREVPPLHYDRVYQLKQDFPQLNIIINGGITQRGQILQHLSHVDGVMVGREACHNPYFLANIDQMLYQDAKPMLSRQEIVLNYLPYIEQQLTQGCNLIQMSRHLLGLFQGQPNAKRWRRHISEQAHKKNAGIEVITEAMAQVVVS